MSALLGRIQVAKTEEMLGRRTNFSAAEGIDLENEKRELELNRWERLDQANSERLENALKEALEAGRKNPAEEARTK